MSSSTSADPSLAYARRIRTEIKAGVLHLTPIFDAQGTAEAFVAM